MAKKAMQLRIDEHPPADPHRIHWAEPPLPIWVRYRYNINDTWLITEAWAMAWTPQQVLAFWHQVGMSVAITAWLRPEQVRRRRRGEEPPGPRVRRRSDAPDPE